MNNHNNNFENNNTVDLEYNDSVYKSSQGNSHQETVNFNENQHPPQSHKQNSTAYNRYYPNNAIKEDLYLSNSQFESSLNVHIKVMGIGSGGSSSVNYLFKNHLEGVDLVCMNTDINQLKMMSVPKRVSLGLETTKGYRAGANPMVGKIAAEESREKIENVLKSSNMVFLIASLGGGTGSGSTPVIAKVAKDLGILTVAVVTFPAFSFQEETRMSNALESLQELEKHVDSIVIVNNNNLLNSSIPSDSITIEHNFLKINATIYNLIQHITEILIKEGTINPDLNDLRNIMKESGITRIGLSESHNYSNYRKSIMQAINSLQLEDNTVQQVKGLLINITTGKDVPIQIINETIRALEQEISIFNPDTNIIWGHSYNNHSNEKMIILIIATGLDDIDITNYLSLDSDSSDNRVDTDDIIKEKKQLNDNFVIQTKFVDLESFKHQNIENDKFININSPNSKSQKEKIEMSNSNSKKQPLTLANLPYFKNNKNKDRKAIKHDNKYDIPAFLRES